MKTKHILTEDNVAEIAVTYSQRIPTKERIMLSTTHDAVEVLRLIWHKGKIELQESFKLILLNRKNQLLGVVTICDGGMTKTQVDLRILLAVALKSAAVGIILVHNHPSGNKYPSESDKSVTNRIIRAAALIEITVVDHIILTYDDHYSFRDEGILDVCSFETENYKFSITHT